MVHTLREYEKALKAQGKRLHLCDENFLHDALKLLDGEFSEVLGIAPVEVEAFVKDLIEGRI